MSIFFYQTDDLQNNSAWEEPQLFNFVSPSSCWTHIHSTISSIIETLGGIWAMPSRETQTLINLHYSSPFLPLCLSLSPFCLPLFRTNVSLFLSSSIHTVKDHFLQLFSRVYGSLMKTVIMSMDILKLSVWPVCTDGSCSVCMMLNFK